MAELDSVTVLLDGLRRGDSDDIRRLWDRYFARLVRLAEARLPRHARRVDDSEDVALSAFRSLCEAAADGRFPRLEDRNDLWRLLSTIARRKTTRLIRHECRAKRGGGKVLGESALIRGDDHAGGHDALGLDPGPTPEEAAAFADDVETLLGRLADPTLRRVALLRLEGHTVEEIAAALGVVPRTVDRKLQVIRAAWDRDGLG